MARNIGGFGWVRPPSDGRDFNFLMRSQMPEIKKLTKITPRKRAYREGPTLDQGDTPQCVGYSAKGFLNAAPLMSKPSGDPSGTVIYKLAQDLDEWEGNNYDGSSVRGGMKALEQLGQISGYVWGKTVNESVAWMNGGFGTIIAGTYWYLAMDNVDSQGYIQMPSRLATPVGGHAYRWNWYDPKKKAILVPNTWGDKWGVPKRDGTFTGYAYMKLELAEFLYSQEAEIAAATQVRIKPVRI